jgi:hypothetical protein
MNGRGGGRQEFHKDALILFGGRMRKVGATYVGLADVVAQVDRGKAALSYLFPI